MPRGLGWGAPGAWFGGVQYILAQGDPFLHRFLELRSHVIILTWPSGLLLGHLETLENALGNDSGPCPADDFTGLND